LLAASILALSDPELAARYDAWREQQTLEVLSNPDPRES
ncbi:MAG: 5-(carboxyamino)imidazole ribonucleotide mutase, partial [Xanthomonadaceae bacterium]|nr:5-(carboxyamino)imidazole ribonucleotide mutase [Xanthomonadaceae bacterium]